MRMNISVFFWASNNKHAIVIAKKHQGSRRLINGSLQLEKKLIKAIWECPQAFLQFVGIVDGNILKSCEIPFSRKREPMQCKNICLYSKAFQFGWSWEQHVVRPYSAVKGNDWSSTVAALPVADLSGATCFSSTEIFSCVDWKIGWTPMV